MSTQQDTAPYTSAMSLGPRGAVHAATPGLVALCGAGMNHRGQEPVQRDRGEISCKRCLGALEGSTAMGMRWARYGDEWTAQGDGRRWVVVEHADGEGTGEKRYTLHSRPLEGGAYTEVAKDLGSLEEAQEAAR